MSDKLPSQQLTELAINNPVMSSLIALMVILVALIIFKPTRHVTGLAITTLIRSPIALFKKALKLG